MANADLQWYRWYPGRSRNSFRWKALSYFDRGIFRELYDIAALSTPRGALRNTVGAFTERQLSDELRVDVNELGASLARLLGCGLMVKDGDETLAFPDFSAHQRNTPSRVRGAILAQPRRKSGARVAHKSRVEESRVEKNREEGEQKEHPPPAAVPPENVVPKEKSLHTRTVDYFCRQWKTLYGSDYPFSGGKDAAHVKKIIDTIKDPVKVKATIDAYLACREAWFVDDRHSLGMLVCKLVKFVPVENQPEVQERSHGKTGKHRPSVAELPYARAGESIAVPPDVGKRGGAA